MTPQIPSKKIDPCREQIYVPLVLEQVPRLLGTLDREPQSLSYGSFDRTHWGWKFCDFPIGMAQIAAYPLALLWRYPFAGNTYYQNPQLLSWIHGSLEFVCKQQHANGSFDSVGPNTQDHGNSLFMTYLLTEVHALLGNSMDEALKRRVSNAVIRACDFALKSHEDYAFISNHQALYALAFHNAGKLTGDERYNSRAKQNIDTIIQKQSPEGWYEEYGGPDPGYESLGIFYLATYWNRTRDDRVLDSLRRSVDFISHFVHPDGSVGGVYGSRHTSLYMPGGFEILASEIPGAAAVSQFQSERLSRSNVLTPASSDPQNLAVVMYTYLEACFAQPVDLTTAPLPCETFQGLRRFPKAGLTVAGGPTYYAVVNSSKGGVCRIFDRPKEKIVYEDAGYLARTGSKRYTSGLNGLSTNLQSTDQNEIKSQSQFGEVRQELPTAGKWIILRLLNLTLFRSLTLGAWLRRKILARLILARRPGPFQLTRSITFGENEITLRDSLTINPQTHVDEIDISRAFTPIHMGSAKYFHSSELAPTPLPDTRNLVDELNRNRSAKTELTLTFATEPTQKPVFESVVANRIKRPTEEVFT